MRKSTSLAILIAVIVVGGFLIWYLLAPHSMGLFGGSQTYQNATYHYQFAYPSGYAAHPLAPEFIVIGDTAGNKFTPKADVAVLHAGQQGPLPSYDDFVKLTVQLACQMQAGDCTYDSKQPYTTKNGLSGETWYFMRGNEKRGPFYTFNVSASSPEDKYAVLVVYPPNELPAAQIDEGLLRSITDSLQINKATAQK